MPLILGMGCKLGKPQLFQHREREEEAKSDLSKTMTRQGEFTRYSEGAPRVRLWTIRWKEAELKYDSNGRAGGAMKQVSGLVYQDGKPASKFEAETATCNVDNRNLKLESKVLMLHSEPKSSLSCDALEWQPDSGKLEARGTVYVVADTMTFGPFPKMIASPDLQEISTPGLASK